MANSYQYLKPETVIETYKTSLQYTDGLTDKFPEYERISRNKPIGSIPKEYPKTTDGTTAAIIRKTPHRVIQQLPTGKIISDTNDWLSVVAEFIYTEKILRSANEDYALLQKCWSVVERFLTFGYCGTYAPFVEHAGNFCTDLRLIYWGDLAVQPGKLSDSDSNYVFIRSWWQTADIDALIEAQAGIDKKERTWDVEALKEVRTMVSQKDEKAKTPIEREARINAKGGVELITGLQRGVGAKFYTFHVSSDKIVRTKINKDPRGEMPVSFAYGEIDGSNPFGRSIIDLVGSMQNLMDTEMQMYQYNRALQLNPPLIKRGNFNKNKVKFIPNIVIDVGSDEKADVVPLKIDTTALANFPNNYGLMKTQILNLLSSPDSSTSAEIGNPGFSKTDAGVKQMNSNISVDDNYVRKMFETWYERWSETAINVYFAERTGIEELQLNKDTADKLRSLAKQGKFDEELLSDDNKIRIDYDTATEALRFEIDASTSKMQDEVKQLQSLTGLGDILNNSPSLQAVVPPENQMALWNALVNNSGVENPEELIIEEEEIEAATQQLAQQKQQAADAEAQANQPVEAPPVEPPPVTPDHILKADDQAHKHELELERLQMERDRHAKEMATPVADPNLKYQMQDQKQGKKQTGQPGKGMAQPKTTPAPKPEGIPQNTNPEDQQLVEALKAYGATDQQIQQAIAMLQAGYPAEVILKMLAEGSQNVAT